MNVSASKIWNESNRAKFFSFKTNNCSYLAVSEDDQPN